MTPDQIKITPEMAQEFAAWVAQDCERCFQFDEVHDQRCPNHADYDPTPWCGGCGARNRSDCHCGPIAENE